jgi:hypothetical protein
VISPPKRKSKAEEDLLIKNFEKLSLASKRRSKSQTGKIERWGENPQRMKQIARKLKKQVAQKIKA